MPKRLGAVTVGYKCRRMSVTNAGTGVRGTVTGHRLGALEGEGYTPPPLPIHPWGRNWSGVEPPLSLQPRLPHGLPCAFSSQCGLVASGLLHCPRVPVPASLAGVRALGSGPYRLGSLRRLSPGLGS